MILNNNVKNYIFTCFLFVFPLLHTKKKLNQTPCFKFTLELLISSINSRWVKNIS